MDENKKEYHIGEDQRYIYSGTLTSSMCDYLENIPTFEPMDVLVSQIDKSGVNSMLKLMERGIAKSLFIDSGAYSIHTGIAKVTNDEELKKFVDDYIEYVNGLDDKIIAVAQVDHIPGVFKQPKKPEDYVESVKLTWDNFLYMHPKMKSPDKLIYVFHQGESFDALAKILAWRDENGRPLQYLGISPSNDRDVREKDVYLREVYDFIAKSGNPNIKTHLFGYTSLPGLPKFPWYTADSVSHRLRAAYAKVFTNKWGTISLSVKRSAKSAADRSFIETADEATLQEFESIAASYNLTIDQLVNESAARTAFDICQIQEYMRSHPYKPENLRKQKRLISLD